jgi:uncharacterized C2H2 Zn-finger protein
VIAGSEEVFVDSRVAPNSVDVVISDEVVPFSTNVVADSIEDVPASVEEVLADSMVAPDLADVLVSDEVVPFSMNIVADSVEEVLDDEEVVHCPRCGTFHAGDVFGEAYFQARHEARRCARCGLVHSGYDLTTSIVDGIENFDFELYISNVEKLEMDEDTILLREHVQEKLDEI